MLLFLLQLVAILPLAVIFFCAKSNKDNSSSHSVPEAAPSAPKNVTPDPSPVAPAPQAPVAAPPPPAEVPPPAALKGEEKKEEMVVTTIDSSIPAVAYLLSSEEKINDEWLKSLTISVDRICQYQWAVKKRLAADDNSWKEIGRKIQKFKDEGFGNRNVQEDPRYVICKDDNKKKGYKKSSFGRKQEEKKE